MRLQNNLVTLTVFIFSVIPALLTQQIPLNSILPPFLAGYQNQTCFLSGFTQTVTVDITSSATSTILLDLEDACKISQQDIAFNSRLFMNEVAGSYYYCAQNQSLMILDSTQNLSVTGNHISLDSLPIFNEVKMKIFPSHPNVLVFLGVENAPNSLDSSAKNYTGSYMVAIEWESQSVSEITKLQGLHQEPIVDIETIENNKIIAIGEKVYSCGGKMNTYYLGKWGDSTFSEVVDFYIASSFGFIPQIKATANGKYLVYTNSKSIFVYEVATTTVTQTLDVTLVSNNYSVNGEVVMHWEEVPFTVTTEGEEIYIFYNGHLDKYSITDLNDRINVDSIPVQVPAVNTTYSRFFFFEDHGQDKALVQIGNSSSVFSLGDSVNRVQYNVFEM